MKHSVRMLAGRAGPIGLLVALVAVLACGCGASHPRAATGSSGFVYRLGSRLYLDGEPYRFKGLNIWWATTRAQAAQRCGSPGVEFPLALTQVAGVSNATRAWFFQPMVTVNHARDWTAFDQTLGAVAAAGMRVIVTLSDEWGSCGDPPFGVRKDIAWFRDGYRNEISPPNTETYRDFVRDVVTRYANHPEILAWQLINEASAYQPDGGCPDDHVAAIALRAWAQDMAGLIRSIDRHHLISLGTGVQGGCGYSVYAPRGRSDYEYLYSAPLIDLCEYHDYDLPSVALPGPERQEMDVCAALRKPFFVGELGIPDVDPRRPTELKAKLDAQFSYPREPSQGELVWEWCEAVRPCDRYGIKAGDRALAALAGR